MNASPVEPGPASPLIQGARSSLRSGSAWLTLSVTVILALAADLITKRLAFDLIADQPVVVDRDAVLAAGPHRLYTLLPRHEPVVVVPHVLNLHLVLNSGAVFGTGQGKRWVFIGFTFVALGFAMWMFGRWTHERDRIAHICVGLIIAGGLGNLYDRVMFACVRDFLHPLPTARWPFGLSWPGGETALWPYVSNVADAFLIVGIGVLMIRLWRAPGQTTVPTTA